MQWHPLAAPPEGGVFEGRMGVRAHNARKNKQRFGRVKAKVILSTFYRPSDTLRDVMIAAVRVRKCARTMASVQKAERSGKRGCGGCSPHLPSTSLPAVASHLQDKPSAVESGGVGAAAFHLPSASLTAVASRLQDKKPSAADSGGVGATAPSCQTLCCPR